MAGSLSQRTWNRLAHLRRRRRFWNGVTWVLFLLGPVLAVATLMVMGPLGDRLAGRGLRLVLLLDFAYLLVLIGLVLGRLARMVARRRSNQAGSRLHSRLVTVFGTIALVPTVLVALFAGLVVNIGLEGWFSDRVRQVVSSSLAAAVAYQDEHRRDLIDDGRALSVALGQAARSNPNMDDGSLRQFLVQYQLQIQRGFREAYIIDGAGNIIARGDRSYRFWYEQPATSQFDNSRRDGLVLIEDWQNNEFRALLPLASMSDRFLYVTRDVDGSLLGLLDDTRQSVGDYQQLEQQRGQVLLEFSLVYLGFALLLVAAAVWLGLWFAEGLSRPIGRLAEASEQVGEGNLDVLVPPADTGDEIETLGQSFNRMTRQLKAQREELMDSHRLSDEQRRLFDSVLSSVTAGVIGLDSEGEIDFMNRSAMRMLDLDPTRDHDRALSDAVPEFAPLLDRLAGSVVESVQDEIRITRGGRIESLLVRMAMRHGADGGLEGYVVALDDVTDLVSAQRMAAWGDVARRVAHEIKNPLTPIQLSAERVRRKFGPMAGDDREALDQYVDVIIRQTNDLRRIVDEFSRFARMPEPDRKETDLARLLRDSTLMQQDALQGALETDIPADPVIVDCDPTMMAQVFTNILKNAGEAIDELREHPPEGWVPHIRVEMRFDADSVCIRIIDNGPGLPADRSRLFEPYVTMKRGGTGLGLPIVKKIVEEHGGNLVLTDAPRGRGAMAEIRLPRERHPVRMGQARKNHKEQEAGV